jgi:hypothetical protein
MIQNVDALSMAQWRFESELPQSVEGVLMEEVAVRVALVFLDLVSDTCPRKAAKREHFLRHTTLRVSHRLSLEFHHQPTAMSTSDEFGDSDDEALIFAATQADVGQIQDDFEESPRLAKRRRINSTAVDANNKFSDEGDIGDSQGEEGIDADESAKKPKYLMHAPRLHPNLDRVVLTQTQIAPASQPWMIRGPIWKKPRPPEKPVSKALLPNILEAVQTNTKGSEDVAPVRDSDGEDDMGLPHPSLAGKNQVDRKLQV